MKNKMVLGTVLAGMLAMGQASADTISLTGAQIAATYSNVEAGIYSLEFLLGNSATPNVTGLDSGTGNEFITGDSQIQVDFTTDGVVSFWFDGVSNVPNSTFTFDFGSSFSQVIGAFTATDLSLITSGAPVFSVVNGHTISADLSTVNGTPGYHFSAVITTPVPEPMAPAMLLAGLGLMGLISRNRTK